MQAADCVSLSRRGFEHPGSRIAEDDFVRPWIARRRVGSAHAASSYYEAQ